MGETEQTTLNLILSAAMQEFLEKGFKSASLRNIVKTAGVTTGAFYGYYDIWNGIPVWIGRIRLVFRSDRTADKECGGLCGCDGNYSFLR